MILSRDVPRYRTFSRFGTPPAQLGSFCALLLGSPDFTTSEKQLGPVCFSWQETEFWDETSHFPGHALDKKKDFSTNSQRKKDTEDICQRCGLVETLGIPMNTPFQNMELTRRMMKCHGSAKAIDQQVERWGEQHAENEVQVTSWK